MSAIWGFHAALKYFNDLGMQNVGRRVRRLSGYLIDGLLEQGCRVNTPREPDMRAGLVTYSTGSHELDREIYRALVRSNFVVFLRYSGGVGGIRVATHLFNTEAEIDGLLNLQKGIMA